MKRGKRNPAAVSRLCGEETAARSPVLRKYSGRCPLFLKGQGESLRLEGTHCGAVRRQTTRKPKGPSARGSGGESSAPPRARERAHAKSGPATRGRAFCRPQHAAAVTTRVVTPEPKCAGARNHGAAGRASPRGPCWKRAALRLLPALTVNLYTHTVCSVSLESL